MYNQLINEYFELMCLRDSLRDEFYSADERFNTVFNQIVKMALGWTTGDFIIQSDGRKALVLEIIGWVSSSGASISISVVDVSVVTKSGVMSKVRNHIYGGFDQIKLADQ